MNRLSHAVMDLANLELKRRIGPLIARHRGWGTEHDDLVQEGALSLLELRRRLGAPANEGHEFLRSFGACRDLLERTRRHELTSLQQMAVRGETAHCDALAIGAVQEVEVTRREMRALLDAAIGDLAAKDQFLLRAHLRGVTGCELATMFGVRSPAVSKWISAATMRLRKAFEKRGICKLADILPSDGTVRSRNGRE